jgi:hypothetical protein
MTEDVLQKHIKIRVNTTRCKQFDATRLPVGGAVLDSYTGDAVHADDSQHVSRSSDALP